MVDARGVLLWRRLGRLAQTGAGLALVAFLVFIGALWPATTGGEPISRQEQINAGLQSHRIYRNYNGDFIMRFPNYDFRLLGPGRRQRIDGLTQQGPIVFRNDTGMYWDGANLFLHPAYPHRMVTRFRYDLNLINEPLGTKWPYDMGEEISIGPRREVVQITPPVAYRPLDVDPAATIPQPELDGRLKFWLPELETSSKNNGNSWLELNAMSTISLPTKTPLRPQMRHPIPSLSVPTKSVSTIRVQSWEPRHFSHPMHDALGTFSRIPPLQR